MVERLIKKRGEFVWEDEDRIFYTVQDAEQYIKLHAGQGVNGATTKFQIYMKQFIESVDVNLD